MANGKLVNVLITYTLSEFSHFEIAGEGRGLEGSASAHGLEDCVIKG